MKPEHMLPYVAIKAIRDGFTGRDAERILHEAEYDQAFDEWFFTAPLASAYGERREARINRDGNITMHKEPTE